MNVEMLIPQGINFFLLEFNFSHYTGLLYIYTYKHDHKFYIDKFTTHLSSHAIKNIFFMRLELMRFLFVIIHEVFHHLFSRKIFDTFSFPLSSSFPFSQPFELNNSQLGFQVPYIYVGKCLLNL